MNLLNKTKTYLVGHMEYADGSNWREYVKNQLTPLGITIFNPYDKPFIKDVDEGVNVRLDSRELLKMGKYDEVEKKFREIRIYDLNLVDRSDFIIAHIIPEVASWGTAEELVTANRAKILRSEETDIFKCQWWKIQVSALAFWHHPPPLYLQ